MGQLFSKVTNKAKALFIMAIALVLTVQTLGAQAVNSGQQQGVASLAATIDSILSDPRLNGAEVGLVVRSAATGEVLYSRNPNQRIIPASNNKLYASTAALDVLGTNYTFKTTVASTGNRHGDTIFGDLYLKGTGDPTIQAADYDQLAAGLRAAGIKKVTGKLVADDSFFDTRQLGNNWAWDNSPFYFQPEVSALTVSADVNYNIGSLTVNVMPGQGAGKPAKITTTPATQFVSIQNDTITGAADSDNTISIERKLGINTIVVKGSTPLNGGTYSDLSTVSDTTGYASTLFREALVRYGVQVVGSSARGVMPANATILKERTSQPLSDILPKFLKLSNNGIAEILIKTMGQKTQNAGTWDAGLAAEAQALTNSFTVNTNDIQLVDGSGLSNLDFLTPQQTTNLLIAAQEKPWFRQWYGALPIAGNSDPLVGGTLRSRMQGTAAQNNIHAKTGSLVGVSAFSGYVNDADGEALVFSMAENNYIFSSPKPLEDAVGVALANFSRQQGITNSLRSQLKAEAQSKASKEDGLECSWTKKGC